MFFEIPICTTLTGQQLGKRQLFSCVVLMIIGIDTLSSTVYNKEWSKSFATRTTEKSRLFAKISTHISRNNIIKGDAYGTVGKPTIDKNFMRSKDQWVKSLFFENIYFFITRIHAQYIDDNGLFGE